MSIVPILRARAIIKKLERAGFHYLYTQGSHQWYGNAITNKVTSVPMHGGKDIGRGLLMEIIKQSGLTVKEFIEL